MNSLHPIASVLTDHAQSRETSAQKQLRLSKFGHRSCNIANRLSFIHFSRLNVDVEFFSLVVITPVIEMKRGKIVTLSHEWLNDFFMSS